MASCRTCHHIANDEVTILQTVYHMCWGRNADFPFPDKLHCVDNEKRVLLPTASHRTSMAFTLWQGSEDAL